MALTSKLSALADAIRAQSGKTAKMTMAEMPDEIAALSGGGDLAANPPDEYLDGTKKPDYGYYVLGCANVRCAAATSVGGGAFGSDWNLEKASFPAATSIGTYAFSGCSSLTSVDLPAATSIGGYAFSFCSSLTSVDLPAATSIGTYAFRFCSSLTSVDLPAATSIGGYAFLICMALSSVDLPAATSIGGYAFSSCTALENVTLGPTVPTVPAALDSSSGIFGSDCSTLVSQVTFRVPASALSAYKADSNWSMGNFEAY